MEFCEHLTKKQKYIDGPKGPVDRNPEFHKCGLKELLNQEPCSCVASTFTWDHGENFTSYSESIARGCPLYTLDGAEAKRMQELYPSMKNS